MLIIDIYTHRPNAKNVFFWIQGTSNSVNPSKSSFRKFDPQNNSLRTERVREIKKKLVVRKECLYRKILHSIAKQEQKQSYNKLKTII